MMLVSAMPSRGDETSLTILSVAYPLLPVGAKTGGGAEEIVKLIDLGLVRSGHRSIVIAAEGSRVSGELIPTLPAAGEITDAVRSEAQRIHSLEIATALQKYSIDVIQFHGLDFDAYLPRNGQTSQLATLHLPIDWYPTAVFERSDITMNCVSHGQAGSSELSRRLPVVHNGVDLESLPFSLGKQDYLLWLGRICPEKGVDIALRVAHRLGMPMIVAGPVHPFSYHQQYFEEQVKPLLDAERRYVGPVDSDEKGKLLANARCVLIPSLAAETSSLVAMEAIGSGTPAIAFQAGALPEIIDQNVTGFLVASEDEMAGAVMKTTEISPDICRSVAEKRFSVQRMVTDYISLYHRLLKRVHA